MAVIEPAKSGRATCRSCREKIPNKTARLGIEEEMTVRENTFTSTKWHHLDCGITNFPDEVLTARIEGDISDKERGKIEDLKKERNKAGSTIKDISSVEKPDITVHIEAKVLRAMSTREESSPEGEISQVRTVYVQGEEGRSKIILWGEHTTIDFSKGQKIVILNGKSELAANNNIQINAYAESSVLVDPDEEELSEHTGGIELHLSDAWNRPAGMPVEFDYAPSGRATCPICEKNIRKGELKLVKPVFIEANNRQFPGNASYHISCAGEDDDGENLLLEAITRMTPSFLEENRQPIENLRDEISFPKVKSLLGQLL